MLLQPYKEYIGSGEGGYWVYWPTEKNGQAFSCLTRHQALTPYSDYYTYKKNLPIAPCTISKLELDGVVVKQAGGFCNQNQ